MSSLPTPSGTTPGTPSGTAGQPAVHSIDEFVFSVPDLEAARHFYASFGLEVRDIDGALALHTYGHPHRWARVLEAATHKRLQWLSLGIHAADLDAFSRRIDGAGIARIPAPDGAQTDGIWIASPDGVPIQLRAAAKSSPSAPAPHVLPPACRNAGRAPARSLRPQIRPLHLSHVLLFCADVDAALAFYSDVLGLRLSDRSGSVIAFLHSPHGSDHHLLALAASHGPGLHHSSWCVPSVDAVGSGARQMAEAGYAQGWGVGRHVLGSNFFRYVRDPWGSFAEYSCDIDFVEAGAVWPAADHPPEDSLYVWGPDVPADFVTNHEPPR